VPLDHSLTEILRSELDSSDKEPNFLTGRWYWRRCCGNNSEEDAYEIVVNDIDDETPAASDNNDDSDTTIDFEQTATSYPPHRQRQRWCYVSQCGLRPIQNIGIHNSREQGVYFCTNSAIVTVANGVSQWSNYW